MPSVTVRNVPDMDTLRLLQLLTDLASRHEMSVHSKPQVSTLSTLGMIRMTQETSPKR